MGGWQKLRKRKKDRLENYKKKKTNQTIEEHFKKEVKKRKSEEVNE